MNEGSSSSITRLNVSPNNLDDQISIKISKITSNPIASEKTLNEIRNLIFYIPITKIEEATQGIAEKILNVAIQTNSVQSSKEIDNFRHELLSLLNTLNYHFNGSIPKEKLTTFFNYISDGSISDLTDALPIIRQTFEAGLNKQFLHEIAKLTISSCSKRIRWLHQNFDSIDSTYFNPFLTLLTVISFCARTFEDLRDQFISIFSSIEEIISKDFQDDTINYSTLPLLALKARMIHCYSLSADILFKNKSLSFLIDSYISILQKCPLSFHLLYEEIAWSFVCLISSKKDPVILQKYIEIFPSLTDFTICDIDFYISRQTIVNKLFETIILSPKCNWNIFQNVIEIMLRFSINSLFVNSIQYIQRISRFQKTIVYIFNKIKDMPPQANYRYHFSILFALHQLIKSMDETAKYEIKTSNEKSFDFNDIQHIISIVSNLFESISKVLECLIAVFESLTELRLRNEKITQSNIPSLPFSQIEIQYVHKIFSNLIFLLVDVRFLSSKCNFRYASQCINSDPKNNSKMCVIHLKLLKCYERVKKCISYIFQSFPKILKKYFHPLFMQNFWNGFFTEFFKRNENVLTNSSFVHSFYLDVVTFSYIIISLLQKCIDELNNPTKGSMVIQTVQQILHKINSQPDHRFDTKEKYVTIALMMQTLIHIDQVARYSDHLSDTEKKALTDKQLSSDTPWIIQDKRFTSLASNIKTGEENTGIRIVKYPLYPSGDVGLMANNLVVLRLTEVYYTLAEVSFRLGNPAKAEAILNQIRKRYYAPEDWEQVRYPEDGSVLTAQELLDEWGREFLAEKRRRTDLNRFGLFTTGIWWDKQPSDSYRRFYPIPARAISANPLLKRSEGYIY